MDKPSYSSTKRYMLISAVPAWIVVLIVTWAACVQNSGSAIAYAQIALPIMAGLIVSLLEPAEAHELGLSDEAALCQAAGLDFVSYPIADRGLPHSQTATLALVDRLAARLAQGGRIGIHCRASIGRSGLLAASLLVREGETAGKAFARISQARGLQCPDTAEQIAWVERFEAWLADLPPDPFRADAPASAAPR